MLAMLNVEPMSTTLTIRNLDGGVKQKLRLRAAQHQRSMEGEARAILSANLNDETLIITDPETLKAEKRKRIAAVLGVWKKRYKGKSTEQIMKELRGDE